MLYKIKHGVFELEELQKWAQNYQKIKEPKEADQNVAFLIKFLENIFQENLQFCKINFNLEYDLNDQKLGFQNYLNFLLKIKEFLELKEDFTPLITFFRTHLNIISYSWVKEMIFYKIGFYTEFLERKQFYMQSLFSEFVDKEQDDYENLYFVIWASYFNKRIKRNYIKFNPVELLKTEYPLKLIQNFQEIDFNELKQSKLLWSQWISISFKYWLILDYIDYLIILQQVKNEEFTKEKFEESKENLFLQTYLIKLSFYFSENPEQDLQQFENNVNLQFMLREEQNFQIFYHFIISKQDFDYQINTLGKYFDYLQESDWFLLIFGSMLIENQDFQNAFILFRRLYDNLKQFFINDISLQPLDDKDLKVDFSEKSTSNIFLSQSVISKLSDINDLNFIYKNKTFQKQLLENIFLVNWLNSKFHFSLQILKEFENLGFDIYEEDFSDKEINEILRQFLYQFCISEEVESVDIKRGFLIEEIFVNSVLENIVSQRKSLKLLLQQEDINLMNIRLLQSIFNMLDFYHKNFKDFLIKVQNTVKQAAEKIIKILQQKKYNSQISPFILMIIKIINFFDLREIQTKLIDQYLDLEVEQNFLKLNQSLLKTEQEDSLINLDNIENLVAICTKNLSDKKQFDQQKLFYLFNCDKESILIWLIVSKYLIISEQYLLAYECLQKAEYLFNESQETIYQEYFNLQVLMLKNILGNQNQIEVESIIQDQYQIKESYCDASLVKEEDLKNGLINAWENQDFDKFFPLADFYSLFLLNQNKEKQLLEILIQIPELIFEQKAKINFDIISQIKISFTKNPLKILQQLIFYVIDTIKISDEQQIILFKIQEQIRKSNNWRTFLLTYANSSCLDVSLKNTMQEILTQDSVLQKQAQSENQQIKQINNKKLKFLILKSPKAYSVLQSQLKKKITIAFKEKSNQDKIDYQELKELYKSYQKKFQLDEFYSGMELWSKNNDLKIANKISLINSIFLLQENSLNESQQNLLCGKIKEDIEINRYLILPLLKFYYENEKDEEFEELLIEATQKKVDQKLEFLINFYVFLFKLKMKEISDEEEEDDQDEIDQLIEYFENENNDQKLKNSVKFLNSIYEILLKKEKNFIQTFKNTKYSILREPRLYENAQNFIFKKYENEIFTL